ncbi:PDDEXK nuclease domain-containing protein [Salana multivorans]
MTRTDEAESAPEGYLDLLAELKARVRGTRLRAARAASTEVLRLYWSIGRDLRERQERAGWGGKVIDRLAADLRREFPEQRGWSTRNLLYMRQAAETWDLDLEFTQQVVARLPWGHVTILLDRLTTREERDWYAARAAENGWSRAVLQHQIKVGLREALGAASTNFTGALESPDSDLAQQMVKDPYVFEHLALIERVDERSVEQALMDRLTDTLLELGRGMAFVGRQVRLLVPDDKPGGPAAELVADLLLFHIYQRRFVVIELKVGDFSPSCLGQLGTYVAVVDDQLRDSTHHAATVGILLCTGKHDPLVRYALASTSAPVAVAEFQGLPARVRETLPSVEELRAVVVAELGSQRAGLRASPSAESCDSA